jgi:phospholipid transport system substrate-binding protein
MNTFRSLLLASMLAFPAVSVAVTPAQTAQAATGAATDFLRAKHEIVIGLLKQPKSTDRDHKIDNELSALIDYEEIAKASLGPTEWDKRTDAERSKFMGLLKQILQDNYRKNLNQTLDFDISYTDETAAGSDFKVTTEAKNTKAPRDPVVTVQYLLRKRNGSYIIVDVLPEGSSQAKQFNKDFTKIIKNDGWDKLMEKMSEKAKG